jgi:hypothetical protein
VIRTILDHLRMQMAPSRAPPTRSS